MSTEFQTLGIATYEMGRRHGIERVVGLLEILISQAEKDKIDLTHEQLLIIVRALKPKEES